MSTKNGMPTGSGFGVDEERYEDGWKVTQLRDMRTDLRHEIREPMQGYGHAPDDWELDDHQLAVLGLNGQPSGNADGLGEVHTQYRLASQDIDETDGIAIGEPSFTAWSADKPTKVPQDRLYTLYMIESRDVLTSYHPVTGLMTEVEFNIADGDVPTLGGGRSEVPAQACEIADAWW